MSGFCLVVMLLLGDPETRYFAQVEHGPAILEAARLQNLDPFLVVAIVEVESGFDAGAESSKRARGLMQIMPLIAYAYGVADPFDPGENLSAGTRYLAHLRGEFRGDRLIAAYFTGETIARRVNVVPRVARGYVRRVRDAQSRHVAEFDETRVSLEDLFRGCTCRDG